MATERDLRAQREGLKLQNDKVFLDWTDELRIMSSSCRKRIKTVLNDRYRVASAHLRPAAELQTQREQRYRKSLRRVRREARRQLADQRRKVVGQHPLDSRYYVEGAFL